MIPRYSVSRWGRCSKVLAIIWDLWFVEIDQVLKSK